VPDPLTVAHDEADDELQLQPVVVVTVSVAVPPAEVMLRDVGETV